MSHFLQAGLLTLGACLNYGGNPEIAITTGQYIGCRVTAQIYELVKADLIDNKKFIFTTGKP